MQIVCPHCTTSYAVDPAKFTPAGRSVRCARCQQVWLAQPEPAAMAATAPQDEYQSSTDRSEWANDADDHVQDDDPPHIQSPPLAGVEDDGAGHDHSQADAGEWVDDGAQAHDETGDAIPASPPRRKGFSAFAAKLFPARTLKASRFRPPLVTANRACVILGTMVIGIIFWRADIVRQMPQTADFFKLAGLEVNTRGLAFEDVRITTETVGNKPVLVIQGAIIDKARKSIDLPRLRFLVRDAQGADIYAWNAVLEQSVINPGEKVTFKSRLASPPAEGREIAVRFFQKRDIAAGGL